MRSPLIGVTVRYMLCILSLMTACGGRVTSPSAQLDWSMQATPATFTIGVPLAIVVTVTNRSAGTAEFNAADCQRWIVTHLDGSVVGPRQRYCTAVFVSRQLAPGASYAFAAEQWLGDATDTDPSSPITYVPPATYLIAPPKGRLGSVATVVAVARQ